jgi:transcriptional regulator with XRE-family HTH domain
MPAACASSEYVRGSGIAGHSQIANMIAIPVIRRSGNDTGCWISQNATMQDADDKNGGPNHLRAWRQFRGMTGAALAKALDITPGMVSDLENSNRALSAKWLRRIAPALDTTPGMLLDHDPNEMSSDIVDIWVNADSTQRRQLLDIAKTLVRTGTNG